MSQMHVKKAYVNRIFLSYQGVGSGLMHLEKEYKAVVVGVHKYLIEKNDIQITALFKHQQNKALHSVPREVEKCLP